MLVVTKQNHLFQTINQKRSTCFSDEPSELPRLDIGTILFTLIFYPLQIKTHNTLKQNKTKQTTIGVLQGSGHHTESIWPTLPSSAGDSGSCIAERLEGLSVTKLKGVKEGLSFSDLLLLAEASSDWSEAAAAVTLRSRRDGSVVDGFGRGRVRKEEEMGAAAMAWGLRGGSGRREAFERELATAYFLYL